MGEIPENIAATIQRADRGCYGGITLIERDCFPEELATSAKQDQKKLLGSKPEEMT